MCSIIRNVAAEIADAACELRTAGDRQFQPGLPRATCSPSRHRSMLGEVTDKGSLNQRMVLRHRAALVDELYAEPPSPRIVTLDSTA